MKMTRSFSMIISEEPVSQIYNVKNIFEDFSCFTSQAEKVHYKYYLLFVFPLSRNEIVDAFLFCFALCCLRAGLMSRSSSEGISDSRTRLLES